MTFYIEPIHVGPGTEMYHIEDFVLVTDSGPKLLFGDKMNGELPIIDP